MGDDRQIKLGFMLLCLLSLFLLASTAHGQQPTAAGSNITDWEVSRVFPAARVNHDDYPGFYLIFGADWRPANVEPNGLLDIAKAADHGDESPGLVLVRTIINSDRAQDMTLSLGYVEEVDLFVNGTKTYSATRVGKGISDAQPIALTDQVKLRLEKGLNEIFMMVTGTRNGWAVIGHSDIELHSPIKEHHRLAKVWETEDVLLTPESVLYDPERGILYVTSFDAQFGSKSEFTGYISRVTLDGEIQDQRWITGLNAPTGMSIYADRLYTLERGFLTEIDLDNGEIVQRHPLPDVEFPNDLSIDDDGNIYITDTRPSARSDSRIYRFRDGELEVWLNEGIERSNGAFIYRDKLLVGNSGDGFLKAVDLSTKNITKVTSLGAGVIDGIRVDSNGNYLVSHWVGQVYLVSPEGKVVEILDLMGDRLNTADFELVGDLLIIPTYLGNRVVAYRVR